MNFSFSTLLGKIVIPTTQNMSRTLFLKFFLISDKKSYFFKTVFKTIKNILIVI